MKHLRTLAERLHTGVAVLLLCAVVLVPPVLSYALLPTGWWPMALLVVLVEGYALGAFLRDDELDPLPDDEDEIDPLPYGVSRQHG